MKMAECTGRSGAAAAVVRAASLESSRGIGALPNSSMELQQMAFVKKKFGEAGGARLLQIHKLWASVAEVAARVNATDVVLQVIFIDR